MEGDRTQSAPRLEFMKYFSGYHISTDAVLWYCNFSVFCGFDVTYFSFLRAKNKDESGLYIADINNGSRFG